MCEQLAELISYCGTVQRTFELRPQLEQVATCLAVHISKIPLAASTELDYTEFTKASLRTPKY